MPQQQKTRRQMLEEFVAAHPNDSFAQYGLAMESAKCGDHERAVEQFHKLLATHPDYVAGYFQLGQLLAELARTDEARQIFTKGISVAQKLCNQHACSEMQAALDNLR